MNNKTILDLMIKDHDKIGRLIHDLKQEKNIQTIKKLFDEFKWEFEKHLFIEERAIFTFYNPKTEREYTVVPDMLKDHNQLLSFLKKMDSEINNGKINLQEFEKLLSTHKQFEEEFFYPKLDEELTNTQKNTIINRLK